ncbi:hypothetical protein LSH36_148g08015, partial [Paralvinella palmiformis]
MSLSEEPSANEITDYCHLKQRNTANTYALMYGCMHIYAHTHAHTRARARKHIHTHTHTNVHSCPFKRIYT